MLKLLIGDSNPVLCDSHVQPGWSQTLTSNLPPEVAVRDYWTCKKDVRLVLHVLTGGPCLALLPSSQGTAEGRKALEEQHVRCLADNKAVVASVSDTMDLLLVAQNAVDGESPVPVFLGYVVVRGSPDAAGALIETARLPLLLDLDETLLSAFTANNLRTKTRQLTDFLEEECKEEDIPQLEREIALMTEDLELLEQFMSRDAVTLDGQTFVASVEQAKPEAGLRPVPRPVIRLPNGVVLTRIDPARKETSMLFRMRPGWDKLRLWLEGQDGDTQRPGHQRFEVYVCTAAERSYALEAWRHLDPSALLIPQTQRQRRFVCVTKGQLKDIAKVMGLPGHPWPAPCKPPNPAMPLAVILDDRTDVWHELSQKQIFKVKAFLPHMHAAMRDGVAMHDEEHVRSLAEEMSAVKEALCNTRGWMYNTLDELLKAIVEARPLQISKLRAGEPFAKPKWPRICNLLNLAQTKQLGPVPTPANSAVRIAAAAQPPAAAAASLKPVDPWRGCRPEEQSALRGVPASTAIVSSAVGLAAAGGRQKAELPTKGPCLAAGAAAAAGELDLARRGSNAEAGPSSAAPKPGGRLRAAVDPRMMAMKPAGAPSKPLAPGKAQGSAALGRGRGQPPPPVRPPASGASAVSNAPEKPPVPAAPAKGPAKQPAAAQPSGSAQPGRKRGLEGHEDASTAKAKRPLIAANGKRRPELSPTMQETWLEQLGTKYKPSGGTAQPAAPANTSPAKGDVLEEAAHGGSLAAAEGPEPQIFSVVIAKDEDGAAQNPEEPGPSNVPARPPSGSTRQQTRQQTPLGSRLTGLGGSFLPGRSTRTTKGQGDLPDPSAPVPSSQKKARAKAPAGPRGEPTAQQAAAAGMAAQPPASPGEAGTAAAAARDSAKQPFPPGCQHAGLDELPVELREWADSAGRRLQFQHWQVSGLHCARVLLGGTSLGMCSNRDLQPAKNAAIKAACEHLNIIIKRDSLPLLHEEPVSARTAIHRMEHLYPGRLQWGSEQRQDGRVVARLSLDEDEVLAEAWALTGVQAKRKVALRLLMALGCPLDDAEDSAGLTATTGVKLRASGAGKPTGKKALKYATGKL